jgi:hypothetical protein
MEEAYRHIVISQDGRNKKNVLCNLSRRKKVREKHRREREGIERRCYILWGRQKL